MVSQDKGPDTRDRILRAAEAEFAARGFDGARVERIAQRAGVNKALLYYYFKSKSGLLEALFFEFFEAMKAARQRVTAAASTVDPLAFWAALSREVLALTRSRLDLLRVVLLEELKSQPANDSMTKRWRQHWEEATGGPGARPEEQSVYSFFFEDIPVVLFLLLNQKWSQAMDRDPAHTEEIFQNLLRHQSAAYWSTHGTV